MKSIIFNTIKLLNKNEIINISLILVLSCIGVLLEFLSLSTIPIFFSGLFGTGLEDGNFISKITNFNKAFFNDLNNILIFIVLIFFFSNLLFFIYFKFSSFQFLKELD